LLTAGLIKWNYKCTYESHAVKIKYTGVKFCLLFDIGVKLCLSHGLRMFENRNRVLGRMGGSADWREMYTERLSCMIYNPHIQ